MTKGTKKNQIIKYGAIGLGVLGLGYLGYEGWLAYKRNKAMTTDDIGLNKGNLPPSTQPVTSIYPAGTRLQVRETSATNAYGGKAKIRQTKDGKDFYDAKIHEYIGTSTGTAIVMDGYKFVEVKDKTDDTVWVAEENVEISTPDKERSWYDDLINIFN